MGEPTNSTETVRVQLQLCEDAILMLENAEEDARKTKDLLVEKTKDLEAKIKAVEKDMNLIHIDENNVAKAKQLEDIDYKDFQKEKRDQKIIGAIIGAAIGGGIGVIANMVLPALAIGAVIGGLIKGKTKTVDKAVVSNARQIEEYVNINIPMLRKDVGELEKECEKKQNILDEVKGRESIIYAKSLLPERYFSLKGIKQLKEAEDANDTEYETMQELIDDRERLPEKEQNDDDEYEEQKYQGEKGDWWDISKDIRQNVNSTHCPYCAGTNCVPTSEITSKGYGCGKACCGMVFLGPFGLLFGLCGMGAKSATWWNCTNCGKKHMGAEDVVGMLDKFLYSIGCWAFGLGAMISLVCQDAILNWNLIRSVFILLAICTAIIGGIASLFQSQFKERTGYTFEYFASDCYFIKIMGIAIVILIATSIFFVPILGSFLEL